MNLSEALQIRPGVTAIIGGGGKTTLMERLAHELSGKARVIVCTTTHIYPEKTMPCLVSPAQAEIAAALAGFAKAVELRLAGYEEKLARMAQLKQYALEQLLTIDGVVRIGNGDAPHILSVSLVGYPSANVVTELGAQGICISAGSACHRGKLSHVYAAMKLDKKTAAGVLRVSFAPETTREEIDALVSALRKHKETRFPML